MPSRSSVRNPPLRAPTNENENASQPASKESATATVQPKRALGDITNLSRIGPTVSISFKTRKIPREESSKVTKSTPVNPKPARRPRTTTPLTPKRRSARLATQVAAAAKSVGHILYAAVPGSVEGLFDTLRLPEGILDIDAEDIRHERVDASYAKDVYRNFFRVEEKHMIDCDYLSRQPDLTARMRAILIDWLVDVHQRFRLLPEVLHLAVDVIDRFLARRSIPRRKLQLVGITSLFIAEKYEAICALPVVEFVCITDSTFAAEEIFRMETVILNELKFEVTVPSALTFLCRMFKVAKSETGSDEDRLRNAAQYLVELALQDWEMLKYRRSLWAAAATKLAWELCGVPIAWTRTMEFYSGGWSLIDVKKCEGDLLRILGHEADVESKNRLTAIKRKFARAKFGRISSCICGELK